MTANRLEDYQVGGEVQDLSANYTGTILSVDSKERSARILWHMNEGDVTTSIPIPNAAKLMAVPSRPAGTPQSSVLESPTFGCSNCSSKAKDKFGAIIHDPNCMWAFNNRA